MRYLCIYLPYFSSLQDICNPLRHVSRELTSLVVEELYPKVWKMRDGPQDFVFHTVYSSF